MEEPASFFWEKDHSNQTCTVFDSYSFDGYVLSSKGNFFDARAGDGKLLMG